jgi:hypothetical protein
MNINEDITISDGLSRLRGIIRRRLLESGMDRNNVDVAAEELLRHDVPFRLDIKDILGNNATF